MRADLVVVPPPLGDAHSRFDPVPKPLQAEILVPKLPVEGFIGSILPRLAGVNQRRFDLRGVEPAQDGGGDELRPVVRAQVRRRAVHADELGQDLDDARGPEAPGDVDRQALARDNRGYCAARPRMAVSTGRSRTASRDR
jgi:hypothetical protein